MATVHSSCVNTLLGQLDEKPRSIDQEMGLGTLLETLAQYHGITITRKMTGVRLGSTRVAGQISQVKNKAGGLQSHHVHSTVTAL